MARQRLRLIDALLGALVGGLSSVLWLELVFIALSVAGSLSLAWILSEATRRRFPSRLLTVIVCAVGVMCLAALAPFKFMDGRIAEPLSSDRVSLRELVGNLRREGLSPDSLEDVPDVLLHFPSRRPTFKEVDAVLRRELGLSIRMGDCGSGVTLLWGFHTMSGRLERLE